MNPINILYETLSIYDWIAISAIFGIVLPGIFLFNQGPKGDKKILIKTNLLLRILILLASALLHIAYYILIKFFVFPISNTFGYLLVLFLFLILLTRLVQPVINSYLLSKRGKKSNEPNYDVFNLFNRSTGLLNIIMIISIVIFSLASNLVYSDVFDLKSKYSTEVKKITDENEKINENLIILNNKLNELQNVIEETKSNTSSLSNSINVLNNRTKQVQIEKANIEKKINELQKITEKEIKDEASYKLIEKVINGNFYSGIIIGFLLSILANKLTPYLRIKSRKKKLNEENES